jgi:hypothetical protein
MLVQRSGLRRSGAHPAPNAVNAAAPDAAPQQLLRERRQRARLAARAPEHAARRGVHLQLPADTEMHVYMQRGGPAGASASQLHHSASVHATSLHLGNSRHTNFVTQLPLWCCQHLITSQPRQSVASVQPSTLFVSRC